MITGCFQKEHHLGLDEEDEIADFRMAWELIQKAVKFLYLYFGYGNG